jgi:O-glycosyl hydrolase
MKITFSCKDDDYILWEGWGTSLAWWAHYIGSLNNALLTEVYLSDILFNPLNPDGLQFNIIRYNIGGGSNPLGKNENLRLGGNVPGYKPAASQSYNWSADAGQLKFLRRACALNPEYIVEAFSNSPPWFLTQSGFVSGHTKLLRSNIGNAKVPEFVAYLLDIVEYLTKTEKIDIKYISPMNEPSSPTWMLGCGQEGCFWGPVVRRKMMKSLYQEINKRNIKDLQIAGLEENNMAQGFLGFSETRFVSKFNIHSYSLKQFSDKVRTFGIENSNMFRVFLRYLCKWTSKPIWLSEWGTGSVTSNANDIENGINLALHIINDIHYLRPTAWVYWQAIENINGGGWGLIQVPFDNCQVDNIVFIRQFWAMAHFSRFIKKNYKIYQTKHVKNGISYLFASSLDKSRYVFIIVNNTDKDEFITIDTPTTFELIELYSSYENENLKKTNLANLAFISKRKSINTLVGYL